MAVSTPIRYHDDVETELPDEKAVIDETVARMRHLMEESFEQHRHATSGTHAKTHGVVTGELCWRGCLRSWHRVCSGCPARTRS